MPKRRAEGMPPEVGRQPTNEEQMMRRQSGTQPTAADWIAEQQRTLLAGQGIDASGATDGFKALGEVIGKEQIHEASLILQKYKSGKANLEQKIIDNEQWYKIRHWECMRTNDRRLQPASAWLFNCIANKHADAMDNFPMPNILPREEGDKGEAEMLSSILPVVLEQNDFEDVYSETWLYKLKTGTGVYGIFWDRTKLNGLGDITIKKIDLLNLFWEPGITDIQKSRNLFHVELADNEMLRQNYPQLQGNLGTAGFDIAKYIYDENIDTTDKSVVVDWYYRKFVNGKTVLHYCKFVNDTVLFATENDPNFFDRGWYDHGLYPFVFDTLFKVEGMPTGFGYIDVGKDAQEYIDRGNQAIMENMLANSKPRHFVRDDAGINENELSDLSKDFVHVTGNLTDAIRPIEGKPLNQIYVSVINNKIEELKETTGNRDVANGGTTSGVTAASAISAMMESGSKLSRDAIKASYRAFRKICTFVIELIRQFYDTPRCFRIMGQNGAMRYVQYSNAGIAPQMQGTEYGVDMGYRLPAFDITVTAQKQSPYSKMSQNELALQFYSAGFFNPAMADQALACLDMMDFDRKEFIMNKIAENQMRYMMSMMNPIQPMAGASAGEGTEEALGGNSGSEPENVRKAKQRVAESTNPN